MKNNVASRKWKEIGRFCSVLFVCVRVAVLLLLLFGFICERKLCWGFVVAGGLKIPVIVDFVVGVVVVLIQYIDQFRFFFLQTIYFYLAFSSSSLLYFLFTESKVGIILFLFFYCILIKILAKLKKTRRKKNVKNYKNRKNP